jgi:hypothetical protein
MNYGVALPYSTEPIIKSGECVSCASSNNDNDNNGYGYSAEPTELCENAYESAVRCESRMLNLYYPDTSGCDYINSILPRLTNAAKSGVGSSSRAAVGFAWLFGISTMVFGSYAYFLYRKIKRGSVSLLAKEGDLA